MPVVLRFASLRFLGAGVLASCCLCWWASPAQATFPGTNGKIVIRGLETLNIDGTEQKRLGLDGEEPAWSPDGSRIVYRHAEQLWVVNSNGTNAHSLGINGYAPDWSPDGSKIVFSDNGTAIKVVNADGSGLTQLTANFDGAPAWSPDGSKIVFHRFQSTPAGNLPSLWIMDANGENETLLYDDDTVDNGPVFADWAPDGSKLVFTTHSFAQVFVIDADGSNATQLTFDGYNFLPVFSPDGTKIAFTSSRNGGIWTMNTDGTHQVRRNTVDVSDYRISWQPLHVTLAVSEQNARFKEAVTVTARLLEAGATNGTVSIYVTPYGGSTGVLVSGAVDANGKLTKVVHPAKRTSFYATWAGDTGHPAGGLTTPITVRVFPRLRGALTHFDSKTGAYRLYDYTSSCSNRGRGCPTYAVDLRPPHAGQKLHFELDLYYRGRWREVLQYKRELPIGGKLVQRLVYSNTSIVGLPTRVRSYFDGDADHLAVKSRWAYFKVV